MSYGRYLTSDRPFLGLGGPGGLGDSQTPYGNMLMSLFPSITDFMSSYGGGGVGMEDIELPTVSMGESTPYSQVLESLFGGGLGDMPQGDVMMPSSMGPDYVQTRMAYM